MGSRGGLHSQCVIVGEILLGTLDRVRQELIDSGELGEYEEAAVETGRRQVIEYLITLHYRNRLEKGQVSVTVIKEEQSPLEEHHSDQSPAIDLHRNNSRRKRKGTTASSKDEPLFKNSRQEFETSEASENEGFSDHCSTSEGNDDDDDDGIEDDDTSRARSKNTSKKCSKVTVERQGNLKKQLIPKKTNNSQRRRKKATQLKEVEAKGMCEKREKKMAQVKKRLEQEVVDEVKDNIHQELYDHPGVESLEQEEKVMQEVDDDWDAVVSFRPTKSRANKLPLNVVSHNHEISKTLNHLKGLDTDSIDLIQLESLIVQQKSSQLVKGSYECDVCHKTYNYKKNLAFHKLKHNPNVFVCTKCNKRFTSEAELQHHDKERHINAFPFVCKVCGKGYRSRMGMKKHNLLTHDPTNKKHSCPVQGCNFATYDKNNLRDHLSIHTGAKNYPCPNCHKQYHSSNGLRRHQFLCLKGGLECQTCGRVFGSAHYLHIHIKAKHTDETFTCQDCGKTFEYKNNLMSHRRKQHSQSRQPVEPLLDHTKTQNSNDLIPTRNNSKQLNSPMQNMNLLPHVCSSERDCSQNTTSLNEFMNRNIEDHSSGGRLNIEDHVKKHNGPGVLYSSTTIHTNLESSNINTSISHNTSVNGWKERKSSDEYQATNILNPGAEICKISSLNNQLTDRSNDPMDSVAGDTENIIHNLMAL